MICVRKGKPMSNGRCRVAKLAGLGCLLILAPVCVQSDQPHGATHAAQAKGDAESADVPIPADNDADHGSNSGTDAGQPSLDVKQPESDADSGGAEASQPSLDGCSVERRDAGSGNADAAAGTDDAADVGVLKPLVPGPTTWTGHVDGYQFPSGSNEIRLALSVDANGRVSGMVVLGDGPPPPPATDPNVGYPPDYSVLIANAPLGVYWAEGFAYSIVSGEAAPWQLEFGISNNELWSDWCAAQTPVDGSSTCLSNWPGDRIIGTNGSPDQCYQQDPANGRKTAVDCGKYDLCTGFVCTCSTTACSSNSGPQAIFYLAIPVNTATGTVNGITGTVAAVHFTQDP